MEFPGIDNRGKSATGEALKRGPMEPGHEVWGYFKGEYGGKGGAGSKVLPFLTPVRLGGWPPLILETGGQGGPQWTLKASQRNSVI